jgi:hypothetical protein
LKFTLTVRKPFNFSSVIHSHGWYQLAPFHLDEESNTLHYILQLENGRVIELKLRDADDGIRLETDKLDKTNARSDSKVNWMFGLDMDFSRFYAAARARPKLARIKQRLSAASFAHQPSSKM